MTNFERPGRVLSLVLLSTVRALLKIGNIGRDRVSVVRASHSNILCRALLLLQSPWHSYVCLDGFCNAEGRVWHDTIGLVVLFAFYFYVCSCLWSSGRCYRQNSRGERRGP